MDNGKGMKEVRRERNIVVTNCYRWKKYGGMELQDARRYRELEMEDRELKTILAENRIKTIYIEPASPRQNGFVESFHDECLNREQLWTLRHRPRY